MNPDIKAFATTVAPQPPEAYFDPSRGHYLVLDSHGDWLPLAEAAFKRLLKQYGLSPHAERGQMLSQVDQTVVQTQLSRNVHFVGALAGYHKGLHHIGPHRVLVTSSPRLIDPAPGEWPLLRQVFTNMLGNGAQLLHFFGWLKITLQSLRARRHMPGQVVAFVGPHDSAKSLTQNLITVLTGGRSAKPYQYMIGGTAFNADLFAGEHLVIEDESPSTDMRSRRAFGAQIKNVTVCDTQRLHAKNRDAVLLRPFWRVTLSLNSEPENVMVLPPIDDSLSDKIMLFSVSRSQMPMPTSTPSDRAAFWDALVAELPAFVAFLLDWDIPSDLVSARFGVRHFHAPEVLSLLDELAPEYRLLALIDQALFSAHAIPQLCSTPAEWSAEELQRVLTASSSPCAFEAQRLFGWFGACGAYLARLSRKRPDRVSHRRTATARLWILHPPAQPAQPQTVTL